MSNRTARVAATPTALVASLAGGGRSRSGRPRLPHVSVPNPVDAVLSGRRRRRRRQRMMRLARNAGAVVSAVTFAADLVHTLEEIKGGGSTPPAGKAAGSRATGSVKRAPGAAKRTGSGGPSAPTGGNRSKGASTRSATPKKAASTRAPSGASSNGRR